jgi:predicted PurR-regulated permease PerM
VEKILSEIEIATSRFLATTTLINSCVGIATALALWAVGLPNPVLWGVVAAVFNFVPYIGPLATATVIATASLATSPDTEPARLSSVLLPPAVFILIHLTENNLVTPVLLGRRLPLNTVAIFLGLISFGWMWGIPGAVIAVPLTVVMKITCDYVPSLLHVGELLGN